MKNLSLYEKINKVCSLGKHAIVQIPNGEYFIVSPFIDTLGNWRESYSSRSIKKSAKDIGSDVGVNHDSWQRRENNEWKYIGVYQPEPYERFQVGDKVRSVHTGKKYLIESVLDNPYYSSRIDSRTTISFIHEDLEPVFEEEEETIEVEGKKYKKRELIERIKELEEVK